MSWASALGHRSNLLADITNYPHPPDLALGTRPLAVRGPQSARSDGTLTAAIGFHP